MAGKNVHTLDSEAMQATVDQGNDQGSVYRVLLPSETGVVDPHHVLMSSQALSGLLLPSIIPNAETLVPASQDQVLQSPEQAKYLTPLVTSPTLETTTDAEDINRLATTYIEIQQIGTDGSRSSTRVMQSTREKKKTPTTETTSKSTPKKKNDVKKHQASKDLKPLPDLQTGSLLSLSSMVSPPNSVTLQSASKGSQIICSNQSLQNPVPSLLNAGDSKIVQSSILHNVSAGNMFGSQLTASSTASTMSSLPSLFSNDILTSLSHAQQIVLSPQNVMSSQSVLGKGQSKTITQSQPSIVLLEGGLANLAALQAGIIQPIPLSVMPMSSGSTTNTKQSKSRATRQTTPVRIIPKPVACEIPSTTVTSSLPAVTGFHSEQAVLVQNNSDTNCNVPGRHPSDISSQDTADDSPLGSSGTSIGISEKLLTSTANSEAVCQPSTTVSNDRSLLSSHHFTQDRDNTKTAVDLTSSEHNFLSSLNGDIFSTSEGNQTDVGTGDTEIRPSEIVQNNDFAFANSPQVVDVESVPISLKNELPESLVKNNVFEEIKVTLSSSLISALPKNKAGYLEELVALNHAELLAVPSTDCYTLTCYRLCDLQNIHSALLQLVGDSEVTTNDQQFMTGVKDDRPELAEGEIKKYSGKKRGRKKKVVVNENYRGGDDVSEINREDRLSEVHMKEEFHEECRYSRSGRRLKLRKIDLSNERPSGSHETASHKTMTAMAPTNGVKRKVGRPRKNPPENQVTCEELGLLEETDQAVVESVVSNTQEDTNSEFTDGSLLEMQPLSEVDDIAGSVDTGDTDREQEIAMQPDTADANRNMESELVVGRAHLKKKDYEAEAPFKYFCQKCSFKTKRPSHMTKHLALHETNATLWRCSKCSYTTLRLNHLRRHEQEHSDKQQLQCTQCKYKCWKPELLSRHVALNHENESTERQILSCRHCDYKTRLHHLFTRHLKVHTISQKSRLTKPAIKTLPSEYFNRIMRTYRCKECSYVSHRKEHFVRHMADKHAQNPRPYLCDTCGRSFKRRDSLKQHAVVHLEKNARKFRFKCYICDKGLRSRAHLNEHMTKHSNTRAYLCEICGASFKTPSVQRKHVLSIHKNPDSFPCKACPKTFNTKYSLIRHEKMHLVQEKKWLTQKKHQEKKQEGTEGVCEVPSHSIILSQLGSEVTQQSEIVLPEFSEDAAHVRALKIELPSGEVLTQPVIEITPNMETQEIGNEQTAASILHQITSQSTMLQTGEGTTALLYLNTDAL